jgi:CheY-like chemotaxis protein
MGRNKVKPEQASKVLMRMPTLRSFGEGRTCGEAIDKRTHAILAGDELAFDLVFSDGIMPGMNGVEVDAIQTGCQVCCGPTTDSGDLREKLRG